MLSASFLLYSLISFVRSNPPTPVDHPASGTTMHEQLSCDPRSSANETTDRAPMAGVGAVRTRSMISWSVAREEMPSVTKTR